MKNVFNYLLLVVLFGNPLLHAQQTIWIPQAEQQILQQEERRLIPNKFLSYRVDTTALQALLLGSPHETDVSPNNSEQILQLPDPEGNLQRFKIVAYDLLVPELQQKWWYIRTWRGISTENPMTTIRLDWTDRGFHAMVRGEEGSWFVDPLYWNRRDVYQVYHKKDYPMPDRPFECHTVDDRKPDNAGDGSSGRAGDCQFREYRLALACTGEYAIFHGGTEAGAASAMATSMNRVNGVYETDLALRLVLIANNNDLIYLDPATDPYTNNSGSTMLGQNQSNIDNVIGTANYDIGHVFSTGGGGIASLRSPCVSSRKARGVTGRGSPIGDPFDIDYVAHEMGHQFGGNHTQNNSCNRSSASMEPGSASTIMGYAGICVPNVQNNSDPYYHGVNIQEIANYMETGFGNSCATIIDMSNNGPTTTAGQDYDIPGDTPFVLTGNASDPDGDPLTYCWEQYDNEVGEAMPPLSSNTQGPMFRSFDPVSSTDRYFPRLTDIINNVDPTWETLPATTRDMDFRVTVRDFDGNYGCTTEDNITLSVDGSTGPFLVTSPNTNLTWFEQSQATVNWDVAGTATGPISCSNVDILLSYDGGNTYPTTLESNTPNDGSQTITVPIGTSTTARVMVRCSDNVFFDISNVNFTIDVATAPDYTFTYSGGVPSACEGSSGSINDVDILNVDITHTWVGDLRASIESPAGTERALFDSDCGSADDLLLSFDDEAGSAISCPRNTGAKVTPLETLDAFDGQAMSGVWTLNLRDNANQDGGSINGWGVKVCTDNFSILPVEWLSFSAKAEKDHIHLQWQTADELDNAGFDIERRSEYETTFRPISWVDAKQDPGAINDYQYVDASVKAGTRYYYRLRQQDYSGDYAYSEIRSAKIEADEPQWEVYPNPLRDALQIRIWNTNEVTEALLFNSQGQHLQTFQLQDETLQTLDLETLPDGVYWVHIRSGSWVEATRIIKH